MSRKSTDYLVFHPTAPDPKANIIVSTLSPTPVLNSVPTSVIDLETRLNRFVQSALQKSRSSDYSPDACMELLDKAWKAQKTVWRLR